MRIRGKHILCWIGIHTWGMRTEVHHGVVEDYNWCKREGCHYYNEMSVNREKSRLLGGD